jgi:D-sedoheptulose 7-phosphate isomerase
LSPSGSRAPVHLWSTTHMASTSDLASYLEFSATQLTSLSDDSSLFDAVSSAIGEVVSALRSGKPLLTCGNGGSASDALHVSGELVGKFFLEREPLNVMCLNSNVTVITAWANDVSYDSVFSRQVEAHGEPGGVLWGFSTSGNSRNVVAAFEAAAARGMKTIAMTGIGGGVLGSLADYPIIVPGLDPPTAQNMHVVLYHFMCAEIEKLVAGSAV